MEIDRNNQKLFFFLLLFNRSGDLQYKRLLVYQTKKGRKNNPAALQAGEGKNENPDLATFRSVFVFHTSRYLLYDEGKLVIYILQLCCIVSAI